MKDGGREDAPRGLSLRHESLLRRLEGNSRQEDDHRGAADRWLARDWSEAGQYFRRDADANPAVEKELFGVAR